MERDFKLFLSDIVESIELIEQYTSNLNIDQFAKDIQTQDAVMRRI